MLTYFIVIVHTWDNVHCQGEPTEWRTPEIFSTEEKKKRVQIYFLDFFDGEGYIILHYQTIIQH